jgi:hypothetical protein
LLIDDWRGHPPTENRGTITLQAGQRYTIKMEYFEAVQGASAQLLWSSPSQGREIIPRTRLYPPSTTTSTPFVPAAVNDGELRFGNAGVS